MVKKSLFILILLVIVVSFTYAGNNSVTVKASPYSWQYVTSNDGFSSKYGFALEAGYRYNIWKGLSVGGDFKYSNYYYEELADRYHALSLMAKVDVRTFRSSETRTDWKSM